jgi:hypothetical protein
MIDEQMAMENRCYDSDREKEYTMEKPNFVVS